MILCSFVITLRENIYIQNVICSMQYSFFHSLIPTALGSKSTVGEFFNPGVSCSDILNKNEDSKDGFYWISLAGSDPIKVRASLLGWFFSINLSLQCRYIFILTLIVQRSWLNIRDLKNF